MKSEVADKILAYLRAEASVDNVPGKGDLGPTAVAEKLGVSKGYASEIITEFIEREYQFKTRDMIETPAGEQVEA